MGEEPQRDRRQYRLHYCCAFGVRPDDFGPPATQASGPRRDDVTVIGRAGFSPRTVGRDLSGWLREQRQARGWGTKEMARQLIRAGTAAGDKSLPGLDGMWRNVGRWERGTDAVSSRYRRHYCRALGIPPAQFGLARPNDPRVSHAAFSAGDVMAWLLRSQIPADVAELRATVRWLRTSANHGELCFLLAYLIAMMPSTGRQGSCPEITSTQIKQLLADNLNECEPVTTVRFSLDDSSYEMDLNASGQLLLRAAFLPYLDHGRLIRPIALTVASG